MLYAPASARAAPSQWGHGDAPYSPAWTDRGYAVTARFFLRTAVVLAGLALLMSGPASAQAGFPNVAQTPGQLLTPQRFGFSVNAQNQTDGRGAIIAFHGGVLYTVPEHPSSAAGSTFDVKAWNIANPSEPALIENFGCGPMNMQAHGYVLYEDRLQLGPRMRCSGTSGPESNWIFRRTGFQGFVREAYEDTPNRIHNLAWERGRAVPGWVFGRHNGASQFDIGGNWFYSLFDRPFAIGRRTDPNNHSATQLWAQWDHLALSGGVFGMPMIFGDLLIFASEEQTLSGLAVYDLAPTWRNPGTPPTLLSVFRQGDTGGYWPELWGQGDRLYVFFPRRTGVRGWQIVDVSQPDAPQLVADVAQSNWFDGLSYVQFQDQHAFTGRFKIDMLNPTQPALILPRTHPDPAAPGTTFDIDSSQFALPLGNLLVTGGLGGHAEQAWRIWAHQAEPDTRGPSVGYHRPRPNQTQWPVNAPLAFLIHETLRIETVINGSTVIVRPVGGTPIAAHVNHTSGGQLNVVPAQPLMGDTEYEVEFPAGGIRDVAGNGIDGYSFRFSTGTVTSGNRAPTVSAFTAAPYPAAPGATVTFEATASDPDPGAALEYRFMFGDGTTRDWAASASATRAYAQAGRYDALVQARDSQGLIASRAVTVTVTAPVAASPPTQSGAVAVSSDGSTAWVVNPDSDSVARVRLSDMARIGEFATGADPRSVVLDAQGRVWVTCMDGDRVDLLDAGSGALLQSIAFGYGSAPFAIALAPDGGSALVSLFGAGEVARIDTATLAVQRIPVGPTPRAIAITGNGQRALVTRFVSARQHGEVYDIALPALTLTRRIALPMRTISHDTSGDSRGVPNYLAGIAIEPGGQRAWVSAKKDNINRGMQFYDGRHELDPDSTVRAQLIPINLSTHQQVDVLVRDLDNSDSPSGLAFSAHGDYLFVAQQGNNRVAIVDVLRISTQPTQQGMAGQVAAGHAPQGVRITPGTPRLLVQNYLSRSLEVTEFGAWLSSGGTLGSPVGVATTSSEPLAPSVLRGKRVFHFAGDERMSSEGYISCASCHSDGGSDGRVWDFTGRGEGMRNNIDLRGRAGTGHGRVHWSANFDEIQDFENDIRQFFGGLGFMSGADFATTANPLGPPKAGRSPLLDDLAAYVASLDATHLPKSPHRNADGTLTAAAERGQLVFDGQGCAGCHVPAIGYRDGLEHDVGTLRTHGLVCSEPVQQASGSRRGVRGATSGCRSRSDATLDAIDTPTLLGLWNNAPYLHDGSADTLDDMFAALGARAYQAEAGSVFGGAALQTQWIDLNAANASYGGFADLTATGHGVTFASIDGGAGGARRIELRMNLPRASGSLTLAVAANGTTQTATVAATGSHVGWRTVTLPAFPLAAGANSVSVSVQSTTFGSSFWPPLALDQMSVSSAQHAASAMPHRHVLDLPASDRADLLALLLQLDGRGADGAPIPPAGEFFRDGFEP
jgi:DNA-binding beta-propeller fold protein YncE